MRIDAIAPTKEQLGFEPRSYTLGPGESLATVAKATNRSEAQLLAANPQVSIPQLVGPGDRLIIPAPDSELPDIWAQSEEESDKPPLLEVVDVNERLPWEPGGGGVPTPGGGGNSGVPTDPNLGNGGETTQGARTKQQFIAMYGQDLWDMIEKVPKLLEIVEAAFQSGWSFQIHSQGEIDFLGKVIKLPNLPEVRSDVSGLAHELGHVLQGNNDRSTNKEDFVEYWMRHESNAQAFFLSVKEAYAAQGINIPTPSGVGLQSHYEQAWTNYKSHGDSEKLADEIYAIYAHEETPSGIPYVDYYGNFWDTHRAGGGSGSVMVLPGVGAGYSEGGWYAGGGGDNGGGGNGGGSGGGSGGGPGGGWNDDGSQPPYYENAP